MKLIASGVANCAASVRSPSFSRSSASQTTTILPARTSSIASSIVLNGGFAHPPCHQLLHVLGEHVDLEVHRAAGRGRAERRALERLGNQRHREARVVDLGHGQRHAVHGDRALLDHVAQQLRAGPRSAPRARGRPRATDSTVPVPSTWPCTTWPPSRSPARSGSSRFTSSPPRERRERGAAQRLRHHVGGEGRRSARRRSGRRRSPRPSRRRASSAASGVSTSRRPPAIARTAPLPATSPVNTSPLLEAGRDQHVVVDALDLDVRARAARRRSRPRRCPRRRSWPRVPPSIMRRDEHARLVDLAGLEEGAGQVRAALEQQRLDLAVRRARRARAATRAASFSPVATITSTPAASSASVAVRAAAREQTTITGTSLALRTSCESSGRRASESNTTRRGWRATPSTRAVSCGSSASAVPMPTATASDSARQRWARARLASPEIHCESPVRVATLPSSVIADLKTTSGRPVRACLRKGWLSRRAACADVAVDVVHARRPRRAGSRGRGRRPWASGRRRRSPRA